MHASSQTKLKKKQNKNLRKGSFIIWNFLGSFQKILEYYIIRVS